MSDQTVRRRDVLRAVGGLTAVGAVGSISGCSEVTDAVGGGGPSPIETVPEDSEYVFQASVGAFLEDEALRNGVNDELSSMREEMQSDELPESTEDALDKAEDEIELDPRAVSNTIFSGTYTEASDGEEEDAAFTIWAEWEEDDLVDALEEDGTSFDDDTHEDKTIYVEEDVEDKAAAIGVLDEGVFTLGTEPYVEEVIETYVGDADPVEGDVRDGYDSSEDGHVRYAYAVADSEVPESDGGQYNTEVFKEVSYGYGSLHEDGDDRVATMRLETESEDAASDIGDMIQGILTMYKSQITDDMEGSEDLIAALDATEADSDGTTMTVTHQRPAEDFAAVVTPVLLTFAGVGGGPGMGDGGSQPSRAPQVSFSYNLYEASGDQNQLEIVHSGGDSVPASELYLTGSGFNDVDGADQVTSGPWQGRASGENEEVVAGDSIYVGVTSDCEIQIVHMPSDGGTSTVLSTYQGPDA